MFGRETRMLLRHYLDQGASKSVLVRQMGIRRASCCSSSTRTTSSFAELLDRGKWGFYLN